MVTFEEALADLILDYQELTKRERARLLRRAAATLSHAADDDEEPIMDKGRWK